MMDQQRGFSLLTTDSRPDSSSSTSCESAACSAWSSTEAAVSCFFSASTPTSPVKVTLNIDSLPSTGMGIATSSSSDTLEEPASEDFDFSARFSEVDQLWSSVPMSSADELFCNGRIRPLWDTNGDVAHWYSAPLEHNEDDGHCDFQSSADYQFSMLPISLTHISVINKPEQYVGRGRFHDRVCLNGPEVDLHAKGAFAKDSVVQKKVDNLRQPESREYHSYMTANHAVEVTLEELRGRRGGGSKERGIRRTRSLSPTRVFHMDDELPKKLLEGMQTQLVKEGEDTIKQDEKWKAVEISKGRGKHRTLKDLLHASEKEQVVSSKVQAQIGSEQEAESLVEVRLNERRTLWSKSSYCLRNSAKVPKHSIHCPRSLNALHFSSPRLQSEQMRQQTYLPYRHGLLSCLSFTSNSYRSMASYKSMHSKSQGIR